MALTDRATVFEGVQIGAEALSAPGTVVPATKRLQSVGLSIKPKIATSRFRPQGYKYDTILVPGKDSSDFKLTGRLDYVDVIYPLASVVNTPTIGTVGTNGRSWTFISNSNSPDVFQTYTVNLGSAVRAEQVSNVVVNEFGMTFKRDSVELMGSALGQQIVDPITMTGLDVQTVSITGAPTGGTFTLTFSAQTTAAIPYNATAAQVQTALGNLSNVGTANVLCTGGPLPTTPVVVTFMGTLANALQTLMTANSTLLTGGTTPTASVAHTQSGQAITEPIAIPVIPGNVAVKIDQTPGAIGTTTMLRVLQAEVRIANRFKELWALNPANSSWATVVEGPPDITAKIKFMADASGMNNLTVLRAGSTQYLRFTVTGPAMPAPDGGQNYSFTWDLAAKVEAMDDLADSEGAFAADFTFRAVHDATLGYASKVVVQNQQTAL